MAYDPYSVLLNDGPGTPGAPFATMQALAERLTRDLARHQSNGCPAGGRCEYELAVGQTLAGIATLKDYY